MVKKAVIVIALVPESVLTKNEQIELDIVTELSSEPARIPWFKAIEKVTIVER